MIATGHRSIAFFCMPEIGHFRRLQPLIAGLSQRGMAVSVFTHREFKPQVECAGGVFFDLFSRYPLEDADATSMPVPCRFVTFAAKYARQICRDVAAIRPSLVIHDSFAVIGCLVATLLEIPRVNVCAGHNVNPARFLAALNEDPRVRLSAQCLRAVDELRDSYGMADASPFSYVSSLSPHLNLYGEPPEFLEEEERQVFEPVAFYGSLPCIAPLCTNDGSAEEMPRRRVRAGRADRLKVYVSFGTVIWRYYTPAALSALACLAAAFARMEGVQAVISLGGTKLGDEALAPLSQPNVSVESYVDQWRLLQEMDLFVTHHGMNSTHEAIWHGVPIVSYPFFWDQPALAARCQRFGLAIPLTAGVRGPFGEHDVGAALARVAHERRAMQAALSQAAEWERAVLDTRPAVLSRVLALI